jgi:hypothetical protein
VTGPNPAPPPAGPHGHTPAWIAVPRNWLKQLAHTPRQAQREPAPAKPPAEAAGADTPAAGADHRYIGARTAHIEHTNDTVWVVDPRHGALDVPLAAFAAELCHTPDDLRHALARLPELQLAGDEPLITLAALAARHRPTQPGATGPTAPAADGADGLHLDTAGTDPPQAPPPGPAAPPASLDL